MESAIYSPCTVLCGHPVPTILDFTIIFQIESDVSDTALGEVLT